MITRLLTTMTIDDRTPATCSAVSAHDVILLEIQRWEDDGGAVFPDVTPRHRPASQHAAPGCTMAHSLAA